MVVGFGIEKGHLVVARLERHEITVSALCSYGRYGRNTAACLMHFG